MFGVTCNRPSQKARAFAAGWAPGSRDPVRALARALSAGLVPDWPLPCDRKQSVHALFGPQVSSGLPKGTWISLSTPMLGPGPAPGSAQCPNHVEITAS